MLRRPFLATCALVWLVGAAWVAAGEVPTNQPVVEGIIRKPDGQPASDALLLVVHPGKHLRILDGSKSERGAADMFRTDREGRFSLDRSIDTVAVVVIHDEGYWEGSLEPGSNDLPLEAWARIEGVARVGTKPAARTVVTATLRRTGDHDGRVSHTFEATTDSEGRFQFERVPAGILTLGIVVQNGPRQLVTRQQAMRIAPGQTLKAIVGGTGRPVTGRIVLPPAVAAKSWSVGSAIMGAKPVLPPDPAAEKGWDSLPSHERAKLMDAWSATPEGQAHMEAFVLALATMKTYPIHIDNKGEFRVEDVEAGEYDVTISIDGPPEAAGAPPRVVAKTTHRLVIPPMPGGRSDEPLDAGAIPVEVFPDLKPGDAAPDFTTQTFDGKPLKLADFRGRFVLLHFWAMWFDADSMEVPTVRKTRDTFKDDPRLAVISLVHSKNVDQARAQTKHLSMDWTHGLVSDDKAVDITDRYGIGPLPAVFLIDPQGKIVARDLREHAMQAVVRDALSRTPAAKP